VYFIRFGETGPIKIGYSTQVGRRVAELQTGSPEELHVVATVPGTKTDEAALHRRFKGQHARGEWYRAAPEVMACAAEMQQTGRICR
jgi:hypothetical protein